MDIAQLQQTLRQFAAERDWEQFHTPKNLAMALMVEVAEFAEIFQWMTPEQSRTAHGDEVVHERIGDEVADVQLYLLQLADHSAIDLERAVGRKLVKNARKHPSTKLGLPAGPIAPLQVASHVLVDWENVQPKDTDIKALVPNVTHVWLAMIEKQRLRFWTAINRNSLTALVISTWRHSNCAACLGKIAAHGGFVR
jgi:NTP pyrophosphatase (non-canonical NTP hydrolase)